MNFHRELGQVVELVIYVNTEVVILCQLQRMWAWSSLCYRFIVFLLKVNSVGTHSDFLPWCYDIAEKCFKGIIPIQHKTIHYKSVHFGFTLNCSSQFSGPEPILLCRHNDKDGYLNGCVTICSKIKCTENSLKIYLIFYCHKYMLLFYCLH